METAPARDVLLTSPCSADSNDNTPEQRASVSLFITMVVVLVSPMLFGFSISFTSPTQATMEGDSEAGVIAPSWLIPFTINSEKWYASLLNIGAVVGAFTGSYLSDRFGRKNAISSSAVPYLIAWAGTALTNNAAMLIFFRLLIGLSVGMGSAIAPVYIGEISTTGLRGSLGAANQLSVTFGIFAANLLGTYAFILDVDGEPFSQWRNLAWFAAAFSLILAGTVLLPESPSWLAKKGDREGVEASLRRLRAGDSKPEVDALILANMCPTTPGGTLVPTPLMAYSKSLVIGIGLCVLQQFSGVNAVIMYTSKICAQAGVQDANLAAMISMGFQVILTGVSCLLMERAGRRFLMLFACSSMATSHYVLGYYFSAQGHLWAPSWLALLALFVFILGFSLGMGPIPWLILAEIFPTEIRGTASSMATAANWTCSFIVTLLFLPLQDTLGKGGTFLMFGIICTFGFFFVACLVPETQGKTVDEVLKALGGIRPARSPAIALSSY
mmetsp:Transcript_97646/g.209522  ORF Transcript_97646/g.209522 Transcript_97646/m.209522 type:complete len:499 (+) Transcript_97646:89-1585(+)